MLLICVKYYVLSASQIVSIGHLPHARQDKDYFTYTDSYNSQRLLLLSLIKGKMKTLSILLNKNLNKSLNFHGVCFNLLYHTAGK